MFLWDSCKQEAAHKITDGPSRARQDILRLQTGASDLHPSDFKENTGVLLLSSWCQLREHTSYEFSFIQGPTDRLYFLGLQSHCGQQMQP